MTACSMGLFGRPKKTGVEAYGKLPFYKDFIALVTTREAVKLREWLLMVFGEEGREVPGGTWQFLFQDSPGSCFTAGLIKPGSDGLRKFPFAVFTVLEPVRRMGGKERWLAIVGALGELEKLFAHLETVSDIDACYALLSFRSICVGTMPEKASADGEWPDLEPFPPESETRWPLFFIVSADKRSVKLLADGMTPGDRLMDRWHRLERAG